jgi:hypothetical protein
VSPLHAVIAGGALVAVAAGILVTVAFYVAAANAGRTDDIDGRPRG